MGPLSVPRVTAHLIENIALEGRTGISIQLLFDTYAGSDDTIFRDACWRNLCRESTTPHADAVAPIQFFRPSSSSAAAARETTVSAMSLDAANAADVWVVACEALRFRALHLTNLMSMTEDSTGFLILETVGKSRALGLSTMDISARIRETMLTRAVDHKKFDAELRAVHHYMDRLISQKLLVKKMVQVTENFKCKRFNMVLLPRFDADFDHERSVPGSIPEEDATWKARAVDYLLGYLGQQENRQCTFNDGMRAVCVEKRKLEAMKNHIISESKRVNSTFPIEIFTAQRADTKQKFWCLRLRDASASSTTEAKPRADDADADDGNGGGACRIVHEVGLLEQIYSSIVDAGEQGITSPDLKSSLGIHGKWAYRLFNLITSQYPVRMEKTVIGRNSVYRLFPLHPKAAVAAAKAAKAAAKAAPPLKPSKGTGYKRRHAHTLAVNIAPTQPNAPPPSATDTTAIRRQHILARLRQEKVVSLYSLRSSIIELENYAHDGQDCHFNSGHRVDVRSIIRIVDADPEVHMQLVDMPIKSSLLASGTKTSRLVLHESATDADLTTFLNEYARDSRIQTLNSKAFVNPNVLIQPNNPPSSTSIAYTFKEVLNVKHQLERDRERQSHLLGKCHGFLYRCRLFHTHMHEYLQTTADNPLLADVAATVAPDRLFLLDPVFQSMTVTLYIRIMGIGQLLQPDEVVQMQAAVKANTPLADLPPHLYDKTKYHQSRRLTKLLRALIDLQLIRPYRLSHDTLMALLQFTDVNGDLDVHRLVQYTLYDRVIGGFFLWHHTTRILFSGYATATADTKDAWLTRPSVRVNATKFPYSFGHDIPLVHTFTPPRASVDVYWEALECCAVETLTYNPAPGHVVKIPPLISTEHINMVATKNWTPNTHGVRFNRRDKKVPLPRIPGTHPPTRTSTKKKITAKPCRPLRPKKYLFVPRGVRVDIPFTPDEDEAMLAVYFAQLESIWRVPVPVEMQVPDEPVAIRSPDVFRNQVSMVAVARAAATQRSMNRIRRRVAELLNTAAVKWRLLQLRAHVFAGAAFHEEVAIASDSRLGALVTRVFMILFTSDAAYNQMAAEHLVGAWTRAEITLVWRYFWLKGWIVAPKPFHMRGFVLTRRFQEIFKGSCTMSYPLALFVEAAEHAAFLETRDDAADDDDAAFRCCGAVEHTALVLGQGRYDVQHTPPPPVVVVAPKATLKRRRDHRHATSGIGLLNHLDQSELDQWHAVFHHTPAPPRAAECAFSHQMLPEPPPKRTKSTAAALVPFAAIEPLLLAAAERGLSLVALVAHLARPRDVVEASLAAYEADDLVFQVQGWTVCLYVLPQFGEIWTVYPFTSTTAAGGATRAIHLDTTMGTTPHPWLKLTTQPNGPWLVRFQRKVVALLIKYPGCTDDAVATAFEHVLPLQQLRVLLADLVAEEVVYARVVARATAAPSLFGQTTVPQIYVPDDDPLLQIDRDRYNVHYFPTPECIVRYGLVAQEINRV
ncbi:Aste57867_23936 [Aphanomyces stellatus]|uniref:Aste57867_23936 protein n=1 Tax=Aphanomyces stellatus TaxID=120398 RepID=A0A485LQ53_9STRA|nr:hypothetical protein As57867_023863 [Aphanomyces stellatus]VFU00579.1 Aste57867_23936 [Aphanomyces stellatus]